jgi:putative ABC transport system substrate-binding protein
MNNRRKLVIALGAGALSAPFTLYAQSQNKVWRVGFLSPRHMEFNDSDYYFGPFREGMRELGYVEGKNLAIEWRSAEGNNSLLPSLATELVNIKVDVIVAAGTPATKAAQLATSAIPIVMGNTSEPVSAGFINSLARPAGNITGVSGMSGISGVGPKQLEYLLGMAPKVKIVAVLMNPTNASHLKNIEIIRLVGEERRVKILRVDAQTPQELEDVFALIRRQNAGALMVTADPFFQQQRGRIADLSAKNRLPSVGPDRMYTAAGVLISYGQSIAEQFRRTAIYVDKILKGARPGDIPVEQPTKFELIINGKVAKALGLKIPQSLLILADKVIE